MSTEQLRRQPRRWGWASRGCGPHGSPAGQGGRPPCGDPAAPRSQSRRARVCGGGRGAPARVCAARGPRGLAGIQRLLVAELGAEAPRPPGAAPGAPAVASAVPGAHRCADVRMRARVVRVSGLQPSPAPSPAVRGPNTLLQPDRRLEQVPARRTRRGAAWKVPGTGPDLVEGSLHPRPWPDHCSAEPRPHALGPQPCWRAESGRASRPV